MTSAGSSHSKLDVTHVVCSDRFAGVERYIASVGNALAGRGHRVRVIGGDPLRMRVELGDSIDFVPAATAVQAWRALRKCEAVDVIHVHMTAAELAGLTSQAWGRAPVVSTRHFAEPRGSSRTSRVRRSVGGIVGRALDEQISISEFVARSIGEPSVIVQNGVVNREQATLDAPRALMLQRLEREKATHVGIDAWAESGLGRQGWSLLIAGSGALEPSLRRRCADLGLADEVQFLGAVVETSELLATSSILLAPAPAEPFGFSVVEAMAQGLPVVAAAAGAHLETVGAEGRLFPPDASRAASAYLVELAAEVSVRREIGTRLRAKQQRLFSLDGHVRRLEAVYESVRRPATA